MDIAAMVRGMKVCFRHVIGVALFVGLVVAPAGAADLVRVAYIPVLSFSPLFLAIEKGFMKEQGIEVEMARLGGGQQMMLPLAAGQLQVAAAATSVGFFNSISKGVNFKVVADKGQVNKKYNFLPLVVNKQLYDSGKVRSPKDIMKLKIAQFNKASISEFFLWKLIEPYGYKYKDLNLVYLFPPKQYAAMKSGAVQATMTVEPWATRMVSEGMGKAFSNTPWLKRKVFQIAVIMYGGKFINETRPTAQRWMNAYIRGLKYHNARGYGHADVQAALSKWTKVKPEIIGKAIPAIFSTDGQVDAESLDEVQRWFLEMGYLKQLVSIDKTIDRSFVTNAK